MPTQSPPGPSRRTLIALLILYLLSVGTSVIFLSRFIGFHAQTPAVVSIRPVSTQRKHPAVVYFYNQTIDSTGINDGFLMFYDVNTHQKVEMLKLANTFIDSAQVSPDGQWVLLIAGASWRSGGPYQLQRIRINGQQHETLYTFSANDYTNNTFDPLVSAEWSLDQKSVLISMDRGNATSTLSLLDVTTRKLRTTLQITSAQYGYYMVKWLDQTHVYVIASGRYHLGQKKSSPTELYLLDVAARQARRASDLRLILSDVQGGSREFDSSPDGKQLFVVQKIQGTITIWVEPATGGKRQILSHVVGGPFSVDTLRVFSNYLLLTVSSGYEYEEVWRMPLDASDHTTLFRSTDYTVYVLNRMAQYAWSNVSRDETMLALETYNRDLASLTLFVSPIDKGKATTIGVFNPIQTQILFIVGWAMI